MPRPSKAFVFFWQIVMWWSCNVFFVSWGKHWKGIYWHVFPKYCVRTYLWGIDWHLKSLLSNKK